MSAVTGSAPQFIRALRERRVALGVTQEALGDRLSWGRTRMHEAESAIRPVLPRDLVRWAAELGLVIVALPAGEAAS